MAASCTITATPATGSQSWTDWIIQQGLTDRGFSRVSLTNFAGTAASLIGTGSVFESGGSIYSTDGGVAIALATGTASAAVAVYIMAIPAAGGTTCTFELDSTAPTWVDAKQGFYASAASTTRAVGGMYIGTAVTYYNKFIYTADMLTSYLLPEGETRPLLKKKLEMGEWNMDGTESIFVDFDKALTDNIRSISFTVIKDGGVVFHPNGLVAVSTAGTVAAWIQSYNVTRAQLKRLPGGFFDSGDFVATASTLANRGFVFIEYEA